MVIPETTDFKGRKITYFYCHISEINECLSFPCKNGGSCKDLINNYTCACVPGYTGYNCQLGRSK